MLPLIFYSFAAPGNRTNFEPVFHHEQVPMLTDSFNRPHDYLRISLTDSCNFRCSYCMPDEKISCMPHERLMQPDEIDQITRIFVQLGVRKIRLTGGEPLVRKEAREIIERISRYPVELTLTSNGVLADQFLPVFLEAGIRSINISMDSLQPERFFQLTKRDRWQNVWDNIHLLMENGLHVKVNVVVMKGVNDSEILDFIELTRKKPLHIRFIEFMPFDGNHWGNDLVYTAADILNQAISAYDVVKLQDGKHDTAKKFIAVGHVGTFAVISTMSEPFCTGCNRMRLTADGKMKNCLFSTGETDLLTTLRNGGDIVPLIRENLQLKAAKQGGQFSDTFETTDASNLVNRSMIAIGG